MKTHRGILATAVAAVGLLALAGCSSGSSPASSSSKDSVTVFISGGANIQDLWQKSLIPAFEKTHKGYSFKVILDLHGTHDTQTIAKLTSAAQTKKDPGYDLVDGAFISQVSQAGLLTPVSTKNIPNLKNVPASTLKAGGTSGIPYRGSSVLLAYNSDAVKTPPKTMDDLLAWIKANPGKFTYNTPNTGGAGQSFVTAVLDKYVPAAVREQMVTGYDKSLESHWDQGLAELASLNPYVYQKGVYLNGNVAAIDLLGSGQIDMTPIWSDQLLTGLKSGQLPPTTKYTQISNPSLTGGAAYLGIPKTSTHQKAALTVANWLLTPQAQELMVTTVAGYPVISLDQLPASVQTTFKGTDSSNLRPTYFASMNQDMNNLWAQKVPGK
ncbi:extracellular solute-binding protein [Rathayibacter soli]|uniref:extracellular solute-binding protein n=1 Tax=Rathayibacter soli TaxID=3144168 RepID=UPI0027E45A77|nr:extracellular solute-binding protein [Glaciibacter superstes]